MSTKRWLIQRVSSEPMVTTSLPAFNTSFGTHEKKMNSRRWEVIIPRNLPQKDIKKNAGGEATHQTRVISFCLIAIPDI